MEPEKLYDHPDLQYFGYSDSLNRELDDALQKVGYAPHLGMRGGDGQMAFHVVTHLNLRMDSISGQIAIGLLTNAIFQALLCMGKLMKNHKTSNKKVGRPVVQIYIYEKDECKRVLKFYLDQENNKEDVMKVVSKRAVILHGTGGKPESNWFMWLKGKLEAEGYEVWAPLLPENRTPNRQTYNDFLLGGDWDFADNIVVGHSSGAVEVLNLLMDERCPQIKLGIMVSAWEHGVPAGMDASQFTNLFPPNGFDFELIKSKAQNLAFMHSADDPYCPLEQAEHMAHELDAPLTVMQHAGHIGDMFTRLPEVWDIIAPLV